MSRLDDVSRLAHLRGLVVLYMPGRPLETVPAESVAPSLRGERPIPFAVTGEGPEADAIRAAGRAAGERLAAGSASPEDARAALDWGRMTARADGLLVR